MSELKILKIIHGYPPYYMAGSEVYTYNLCNELKKHPQLSLTLFTRIEDLYLPPYYIEKSMEGGIRVIRVNKPQRDYLFRDKYIDKTMARIFEKYLEKIQPDVVHIGHLSHLTVLVIDIIKDHHIPILFTLHDYWMMCVRGQLIKKSLEICPGPTVERCLECNQKYFHNPHMGETEVKKWIAKMLQVNNKVDLFIAPSQFLRNIYINYGIPAEKIIYQDYGFKEELFQEIPQKLSKSPAEKVRFGFLGRIIPVKGIDLLIRAFNPIDPSHAELNIYGNLDKTFPYLKKQVKNPNIHFYGGYKYHNIAEVLTNIDVLVVPSVWYENSPLVIHEALLASIPVITSNLGGMKELIQDGKNGLLFEVGNETELRQTIKKLIQDRSLLQKLTVNVAKTRIRSIEEDAADILHLYLRLIKSKEEVAQFARSN